MIWITAPRAGILVVGHEGERAAMTRAPEHASGEPVLVTGIYQQVNVFGSPTVAVVRAARGEMLRHAPIGFGWRLMRELADEEG